MKLLIKKIILFSCIALVPFYILQYISDKGLRKSKANYFSVWNDIYDSRINCDLLIQGGSCAYVQVSPKILDSCLNLNSYNIGIDGYRFSMQYTRFIVYLQHNIKPKYIVHVLTYPFFLDMKDLYNYQQFIPFYNDTIIKNALKNYNGAPSFAEYFYPFYKYNNNLYLAKEGIFSYFNIGNRNKNNLYKGYLGVEKSWDNSFESFKNMYPNGIEEGINPKDVSKFNEYLKLCKNEDIKVILVFPPLYCESNKYIKNADKIINLMKNIAEDNRTPFLDYRFDTLSKSKIYYYNSQHLNKIGSEIFSKNLSIDIKKILTETSNIK